MRGTDFANTLRIKKIGFWFRNDGTMAGTTAHTTPQGQERASTFAAMRGLACNITREARSCGRGRRIRNAS